jgi:hypothetical protein
LFAAITLAGRDASARVIDMFPGDNLRSRVAALVAGDELVIHAGTYSTSTSASWFFSATLVGTGAAPIVIRAAAGEHVVIAGDPTQTADLLTLDAEFVTLRGLEMTGGARGIRITRGHDIAIENCVLHGFGGSAVTANAPGTVYTSLRIAGNEIYDTGGTGEALYFGCTDASCEVDASTIEGNWLHDLVGTSGSMGTAVLLKTGSHDNSIRGNVLHDLTGGAIVTSGSVGRGGANVIEENVAWNVQDSAIQVIADAVVRNNIVLSSAANGISLLGAMPGFTTGGGNVSIVNNTVVGAAAAAIRIVGGTTGPIVVANNAAYSESATAISASGDLSMTTFMTNVVQGAVVGVSSGTMPGSIASDFVAASFSGGPPNDVFPTASGALAGTGSAAFLPTRDFNDTVRTTADVGAYQVSAGGNPGWTIAGAFHVYASTSPGDAGVDAGSEDAGAIAMDAATDASGDAASLADAPLPGDETGAVTDAGSGPDESATDAGDEAVVIAGDASVLDARSDAGASMDVVATDDGFTALDAAMDAPAFADSSATDAIAMADAGTTDGSRTDSHDAHDGGSDTPRTAACACRAGTVRAPPWSVSLSLALVGWAMRGRKRRRASSRGAER